jgi:hypothetical protein
MEARSGGGCKEKWLKSRKLKYALKNMKIIINYKFLEALRNWSIIWDTLVYLSFSILHSYCVLKA